MHTGQDDHRSTKEWKTPQPAFTGPYWEVDSVKGYSEITGFAETPSNQLMKSTNDVQYMFFGPKASGGADAGVFITTGMSDYQWFITGGTSRNGWRQGSLGIPAEPGKTLYIWLKVLVNKIQLRIIDTDTWTTVVDVVEPMDTSKKIYPTNPDLRMFKVTSMAQHDQNLKTGSYFFDARWYDVYVNNNSGYGLLDTTRTACVDEYPDSPDVVNTTIVNAYDEDYVDIDLR